MEQLENIIGMLDLMVRPAFCVKDSLVAGMNRAAKGYLIGEGTPVCDLIDTGREEFSEFTDGCLYLTLCLSGHRVGASVTKQSGYDVFILEQEADQSELRAMALAAQELREPLASVMTVADRLFPMIEEEIGNPDQVARINRGLYQILRTVSNMSDAARYHMESERLMEIQDVTAVLEEIFEAASALISQTGIEVRFHNLSDRLYMLMDQEKLERAVHNILSNAIKFTPKNGIIEATLSQRGRKLYLTVQDSGAGVEASLRGSIHSRYQRQPELEDSRFGIGLGMVLIRAAAATHGGTVLMEHPTGTGARITMTMEIRQETRENLRTPILKVDYSGERNHCLIELSDSLPAAVYRKENIN